MSTSFKNINWHIGSHKWLYLWMHSHRQLGMFHIEITILILRFEISIRYNPFTYPLKVLQIKGKDEFLKVMGQK